MRVDYGHCFKNLLKRMNEENICFRPNMMQRVVNHMLLHLFYENKSILGILFVCLGYPLKCSLTICHHFKVTRLTKFGLTN